MSMPMSTDGKRDMFWRSDWDPVAQAAQCMEQYGVSPGEGWGAAEYGGYDSWSQGETTRHASLNSRGGLTHTHTHARFCVV